MIRFHIDRRRRLKHSIHEAWFDIWLDSIDDTLDFYGNLFLEAPIHSVLVQQRKQSCHKRIFLIRLQSNHRRSLLLLMQPRNEGMVESRVEDTRRKEIQRGLYNFCLLGWGAFVGFGLQVQKYKKQCFISHELHDFKIFSFVRRFNDKNNTWKILTDSSASVMDSFLLVDEEDSTDVVLEEVPFLSRKGRWRGVTNLDFMSSNSISSSSWPLLLPELKRLQQPKTFLVMREMLLLARDWSLDSKI